MAKTASEIAEEAINSGKLEEDENKVVEETKEAPKTEEKKGDKNDEKAKDTADADESGAEDADTKEPDEEEGEFTADDALEVEENPKAESPVTDSSGVQYSQEELKYIQEHINEIGEPVTFTGKIGDKEVSYKVWDVNQLPRDFQPDSIVAFNQGVRQLATMEQKAEKMLQDRRNQQGQEAAQDFERRENEGIRQDVATLQTDGVEINGEVVKFPKFKVQPGAKGFDDTPEAKQMAEVLELMTNRNQQYLHEYNQGRPYKHIGFAEAFEMWYKRQPARKVDAEAKAEDEEREKVAEKVGSNASLTNQKLQKPRVRSGVTVDDILRRYETEL